MDEASDRPKRKDAWDKADIVLKGLIAVLLPGAIAFYGYWTERQTAQRAQKSQSYEATVQTLSNRESVAADLRAKMFTTLMEHYFNGSETKKIAVLEMIAMNFDEQFQLRPLFEALESDLKTVGEKTDLRRVAKNLADREVASILAAGGQVCDVELELGKPVVGACAPVAITLKEVVLEDKVVVGVPPPGPPRFEVNYFDLPLADHTTVGELSYSVLLQNIEQDGKSAKAMIVVFPRYSYSLQSRLQLDQLIGGYLAPGVEFAPPWR